MSTEHSAPEGAKADLATEIEDDLCPYCGLDPYHYEDVGTAFPARVAIVCCEGRRTEMATDWQPIETAPKDGTEIIGVFWHDYGDGPRGVYGPWTIAFSRGRWRSSWDGAEVIENQSDFGTDYKSPDIQPTHWTPMPAPPDPAALPHP